MVSRAASTLSMSLFVIILMVTPCTGSWIVVAQLKPQLRVGLYNIWMSSASYNDTLSLRSTRLLRDTESNLMSVYKSGIVNDIDEWSKYEEAKFVIYNKNYEEVKFVQFDIRNTDKITWFDKANIIDSSYTDLIPTVKTNVFAIAGHYMDDVCIRRWMISYDYSGCTGDSGWFLVTDPSTVSSGPCEIYCSLDRLEPRPNFWYSSLATRDTYQNFVEAGLVAIWLKRNITSDFKKVSSKYKKIDTDTDVTTHSPSEITWSEWIVDEVSDVVSTIQCAALCNRNDQCLSYKYNKENQHCRLMNDKSAAYFPLSSGYSSYKQTHFYKH